MKNSIRKIFKNLHFFLLFTLMLGSISFLFISEQYYSFEKVNNLHTQKNVLLHIVTRQEASNKIDIYTYNGEIANIKNALIKLRDQNQYNYISHYIFDNTKEYIEDLKYLDSLIQNFDKESRLYFALEDTVLVENSSALTEKDKNLSSDKDLNIDTPVLSPKEIAQNKISTIYRQVELHVDRLVLKNITYDQERFNISSKVFLTLLVTLLLLTIWYKGRLSRIYKDILFLFSIDANKNTKIFSQEVATILLRIHRKSQLVDNPAMIDAVTEIHNNKGMMQAYSERKSPKNTNFTSVTILEIDNFSKSKRAYSQEFTQSILKKVAYTISLHQEATDIIARSDYNQFTLIFSRPSTEQLFKDTDLIRQSIAEIQLVTPEQEAISISVTGALSNQPNNAPLEESIRKTKDLLHSAKKLGTNRIIQKKDLPK